MFWVLMSLAAPGSNVGIGYCIRILILSVNVSGNSNLFSEYWRFPESIA